MIAETRNITMPETINSNCSYKVRSVSSLFILESISCPFPCDAHHPSRQISSAAASGNNGWDGFSAAAHVHSRTHALQQTSRLVTYWITSSARVISRSVRNTRAANRWQRVVRRQVGFLDFPAAEQGAAATKRAGASPRTPIVYRCVGEHRSVHQPRATRAQSRG